ncbi:LuxR C-terminal-related transcriptional regulator [Actinomycetes bacterium KLBMP 9759]
MTGSGLGRTWPLVGRDAELGFVVRGLRGRGTTGGVVLAGAPGVGKTRLAREVLAAAGRSTTRWVVATESARAVPLGCFGHLLRSAVVAGPGMIGNAADDLLGEAPGVVIGVDDAHLLDDASAALVHHLAAERGVPTVVTLRSGGPAPDAVTALWKDGHLPRLDLQALSTEDTGTLLAEVLGGPVEGSTVQRLWDVTAGNALYLRHLVDGELDAGRLRRTVGVWQWRGDLALPPPLRELVDASVGQLPDAVRHAVELVALGEPVGVRLLTGLVEPEALDEAERRKLVVVTVEGARTEARLAHPLHGEAVREALSTLRARRLRGQLAGALAATGCRRSGDLLRLADLVLGSDRPADAKLLADAAVEANRLGAIPLAERLSHAASTAGTCFESELMLGYAHGWQGRAGPAAERLAAATALAGSPEQRVRATIAQASLQWWGLGDGPTAVTTLEAGLRNVVGEPLRDELRAVLAVLAMHDGRTADAAREARAVLEAPVVTPRAATFAGNALTVASAMLGRPDDAVAAVGPALAASGSLPETAVLRAGIWWGHLLALRLAGRLDEAATAADRYVADAGQSPLMRCKALVYRAGVQLDQGRIDAVPAAMRETVACLDGSDPADWTFSCHLALATALGMAGDATGAGIAAAAARTRFRATVAMVESELRLAEAWVAAAEGALTEAVAAARDAAALAADGERAGIEVVALHTAVCFGDRTVARRLAELADRTGTPRALAAAHHAAALAAGDAAGLDAAASELLDTGAVLLAADATAQAALAYGRAGRRGASASVAARANRLAERCPGARTPALRAIARPLPITTREREIASLIARGLSNQAIAERLVVSVRTVEGHIYRACTKLDVTDRAALASLVSVA